MRPLQEWDESDLDLLIQNKVEESLTLDYKASDALEKNNDRKKKELAKDVSAFANSDGGMLIYGIAEDGNVPTRIDEGTDQTFITKEWLEQVISSHVHPAIEGILIKPIPLGSKSPNAVAYVIQIPKATSLAPHQATDYRYYKRLNFESKPMEDYEVRDLMRRGIEYGKKYGAAWNLHVEVNRLVAAILVRDAISGNIYFERDRLIIRVSNEIRFAGDAIILLQKPLRQEVVNLIEKIDSYNSAVEVDDPGQYSRARLTDERKKELKDALLSSRQIAAGLKEILDKEP